MIADENFFIHITGDASVIAVFWHLPMHTIDIIFANLKFFFSSFTPTSLTKSQISNSSKTNLLSFQQK